MKITHADAMELQWDSASGLLPAIVQDAAAGTVLMLGYMNRAALEASLARGRVVFYSRSRQCLWEKGETSGHHLALVAVHADCDRDALLVTARPAGPTCHTGTRSCFGDAPHGASESLSFLAMLEQVIAQRVQDNPEGSYTAALHARGITRMAQKVGEEGVEVALAAATGTNETVIGESADLLFHHLLLLHARGIPLARVVDELAARHAAGSRG
jgi:phosphoribosyl-ATP pyrophosphohydrolase/phosphoribosyl-AMP cyclohydrolase